MTRSSWISSLLLSALLGTATTAGAQESMDQMWGEAKVQVNVENTDRATLFRDGHLSSKTSPKSIQLWESIPTFL